MTRALERFGWLARSPERSLWLVVDGPARFPAAERLARALDGRLGRLAFFATAASGERSPAGLLLPAPKPFAAGVGLALRRLRTRAVIVIGPETAVSRALVGGAVRLGLAVFVWDGEGAPPDDLAGRIQAAVRANPRNTRLSGGRARLAERALAGRLPFALGARRLCGLADLRAALGAPETILCLGNGPSSNDPAAVAAAAAADAVFRVKHRWLKEGRVRRVDVVFTGAATTAARLPDAILMAQDRRTAGRIALARAWRTGWKPLRLGVVEEMVSGYAPAFGDGARLTNGAAMLATAVALAPRRLIVAGVDLYSHPSGAYPGTPETANAYAPAHDAARERAHALAMLARQLGAAGPDSLRLIGPLGDIATEAGLVWTGPAAAVG